MPRFESYGGNIPGLDPAELTGWLIVIEGTDGVGRSTHVTRLRAHLERRGYAVADTGLSRSDLASQGIRRAKQGNTLGTNSFNLFYATDFADRLERQVLPALRAGFVMLTDRYTYSLIARAIVRGAEADWIKQVYAFSLKPDAVFYLRIEVPALVPRVLANGGFDYWESGMDLPLGVDLYESFIRYQQRVIEELDGLAREYAFDTIDATQPIEVVADYLAGQVDSVLQSTPAPAPRTGFDGRPRGR
jgi:dTMP kinase